MISLKVLNPSKFNENFKFGCIEKYTICIVSIKMQNVKIHYVKLSICNN